MDQESLEGLETWEILEAAAFRARKRATVVRKRLREEGRLEREARGRGGRGRKVDQQRPGVDSLATTWRRRYYRDEPDEGESGVASTPVAGG